MEKNNLTTKQRKVFEAILEYSNKNSQSPTISELAKILKVKSTRTVAQYLEILERKQFISKDKYAKRGITPIRKESYIDSSIIQIPVVGSAGCDNQTILANPTYGDYISVSKELLGNVQDKFLAVRAVGSSMTEAGIFDGDVVLVDKTVQVKNNDRVLAVIDDNAVIKRIIFTENSVILNPDSKDESYKPIVMKKDFKVVGKVVDVIKKQKHGYGAEEEIIPISE